MGVVAWTPKYRYDVALTFASAEPWLIG